MAPGSEGHSRRGGPTPVVVVGWCVALCLGVAGCPAPEPQTFQVNILVGAKPYLITVAELDLAVTGSGGGSITETFLPSPEPVFGFPWMAPAMFFNGLPGNANITATGRDSAGVVVAAGNEPIELYDPVVDARVSLSSVSMGSCGDGIVNGLEQCDDGNFVDGDGCSASCVLEGICSNGVVDPGEDCDRNDLAGASCASLGMGSGELLCAPDCTFDTSGCSS